LWFWREVAIAILTNIWSDIRQDSPILLAAIAVAWILAVVWHWLVTPVEYSLLVRYVIGGQARLDQMDWVGFLLEAPIVTIMGWTAARVAGRRRSAAVLVVAASGLASSAWSIWANARIVRPVSPDYHFSTWSLWPIPLLTVLVLFGGGLLTGSPKTSATVDTQ
jgi:hypothetical protein